MFLIFIRIHPVTFGCVLGKTDFTTYLTMEQYIIRMEEQLEHIVYSSNSVRDCCEANQGNLWVATFNGLDKFDKKKTNLSIILLQIYQVV